MTQTVTYRVRAPFASFRQGTRTQTQRTYPTIPHSSAYGLTLNIGGIDVSRRRESDVRGSMPDLEIAVAPVSGAKCLLFEHQHTTHEKSPPQYGQKPRVQTKRREYLFGFEAVIAARGADEIIDRVRAGLRGEVGDRWGGIYLGHTTCLPDLLEEVDKECRWLQPYDRARSGQVFMLCVASHLAGCAPRDERFQLGAVASQPVEDAWIHVPRAAGVSK